MKHMWKLLLVAYMLGKDKLLEVLYLFNNKSLYTCSDYEYFSRNGYYEAKRLSNFIINCFPKSLQDYISRYVRVFVSDDTPNEQKLAAHLIDNLDPFLTFADACAEHLPSVKDQAKYYKYRRLVHSKLYDLQNIAIEKYSVETFSVYDALKKSLIEFTSVYPIKRFSIYSVYNELKTFLKTIPPELRKS